MTENLLFAGSVIIFGWGVAHIFPVANIIKDFRSISRDHKRLIAMEWIAEGLSLCFIGLLVFIITLTGRIDNSISELVIYACAGFLIVLAVLSAFTGARTKILPMKICPFVKTIVVLLFIFALNS